MCKLKSAIILKERIFMPDYDSHSDMLEELGINDDYLGANKKFVEWMLDTFSKNVVQKKRIIHMCSISARKTSIETRKVEQILG